RQKFVQCN
ncbi:chorismate binding enzyme family protein, partial [Vibrio parahaemolyticus V-223/04]